MFASHDFLALSAAASHEQLVEQGPIIPGADGMSGEDDLLAMEAVVRAVERAQAVPSHRRSAAFLQLTRMAKAAKKQGQMREKASERISRLILRRNAEFAKTDSDVIDLAAKGYKSNGKGKHKVWLPGALQRACWGHRQNKLQVSKRMCLKCPAASQKRKRSVVAQPTVSSCREWARHLKASATHIGRVQRAVSERSVPPFRPDGCTALHMACGAASQPGTRVEQPPC